MFSFELEYFQIYFGLSAGLADALKFPTAVSSSACNFVYTSGNVARYRNVHPIVVVVVADFLRRNYERMEKKSVETV